MVCGWQTWLRHQGSKPITMRLVSSFWNGKTKKEKDRHPISAVEKGACPVVFEIMPKTGCEVVKTGEMSVATESAASVEARSIAALGTIPGAAWERSFQENIQASWKVQEISVLLEMLASDTKGWRRFARDLARRVGSTQKVLAASCTRKCWSSPYRVRSFETISSPVFFCQRAHTRSCHHNDSYRNRCTCSD